jgi:dTDP-glucose 4,6-dehydratase
MNDDEGAHPLARDLGEILDRTDGLWEAMRGARFFLTGGTGFVGVWLLESFLWANRRHGLGARVVVLSRSPESFARRHPTIARAPGVAWHAGDIRDFSYPEGEFSHIIHAAAEATTAAAKSEPADVLSTHVDGTRRVLEFAKACGARDILFTSSGAVYGKQPSDLPLLAETCPLASEAMAGRALYGEGKRLSEALCASYGKEHGLACKVARCFAFVGPHLPLDGGYAVGSFIRDALDGSPVRVSSDGSAWRSYLYAGDLAAWLWTILLRGTPGLPYNVGSSEAVTIGDVARLVARVAGHGANVILGRAPSPEKAADRYVPKVERAKIELGLAVWTGLEESIKRTLQWHRSTKGLG